MVLSNNQIYRIENLVSLPVINMLNLSNNLIHKLENFDALGTLRVLHLDNNFIETLQNLQGMTRLEELTIRNNKLRSVAEVGKLQWLVKLDVSSNVLTEFDVSGLCPSLVYLDISLNKLRNIHSVQKSTLKLKSLHVQQNPLNKNREGKLPMGNFRDLEILTIDSYLERALIGLLEDCKVNGKMILPGAAGPKKRSVSPSPDPWQNDMTKMKSLKKGFSLAKEIKRMRKKSNGQEGTGSMEVDRTPEDFNELQHEIQNMEIDEIRNLGKKPSQKRKKIVKEREDEQEVETEKESRQEVKNLNIPSPGEPVSYPQVIPDQPKAIEQFLGNSQKMNVKQEQIEGKLVYKRT